MREVANAWVTGSWRNGYPDASSCITGSNGEGSIRTGRLRQRTGYLRRRVNLSGATSVHLTFWAKVKSFEGSDQALVQVSPDGATFTTVKTFTSANSDNIYHLSDIDLSGFAMTSNFQIAFDAQMSSTGDYWFLDKIEIVGVK